jgi:hypothetical protein
MVVRATAATQQAEQTFSQPPTSFSAEDANFPDAVPLTDCVRTALARDEHVLYRLNDEHLSPEKLPQNWFTASERKLGQGIGTYVVVMGAEGMRGANVNPFWIFLQHTNSCDLLLSLAAHNLEVLKAKTGGLPDVKVAAATAATYFANIYKFDGHQYRLVRRTSEPIGEEIPKDLSGFETRSPLVQGIGQSPDSILSEARSWLWRRWWLEKRSYLTVVCRSKEGDKTTTTYFTTKVGSKLRVMIHTHMIVVDRSSPRGSHSIVEDELVVADDVERRLALKGNPDRTKNVPENEAASPDVYELYFDDDFGNNLAVL